MGYKRGLGKNVHEAALERVRYVFDNFPRVYISFSGGKDSTCMMHLTAQEARRRGRKIGCLFVDLEGQYKLTIDHIHEILDLYKDVLEVYWICLPLNLRNAVSAYEPQWCCWEPGAQWVRPLPKEAINDQSYFPFYHYRMEFEEFVPKFGEWYGQGKLTACLVRTIRRISGRIPRTPSDHGRMGNRTDR